MSAGGRSPAEEFAKLHGDVKLALAFEEQLRKERDAARLEAKDTNERLVRTMLREDLWSSAAQTVRSLVCAEAAGVDLTEAMLAGAHDKGMAFGGDAGDAVCGAVRALRDRNTARAERDAALAEAARLRTENERLKRACAEGLPREVILCPACGKRHVDGANGEEFATRPHHTHLCQYCNHVWDRQVWSFGAAEGEETVPAPDALARLTRERDDARGDYDAVNFDAARVVEAWEELAPAEQHDVHRVYFGRLAKRVEELRDHGFGRWWVDAVKDGPREPPSTALRAKLADAESVIRRVWAACEGEGADAPREMEDVVWSVEHVASDRTRAISDYLKLKDQVDPPLGKDESWPRENEPLERGEVEVALEMIEGFRRRSDAFERAALRTLLALMPVPARALNCTRCSGAITADNPRCTCGECVNCHLAKATPGAPADGQLPQADVVPWLVFGVKYEGVYSEGQLAAALGLDRLDVRELALKGRDVHERLRDERIARVRAEVGRPPETPEERDERQLRALCDRTFHGQRIGQALFNGLVRLGEDFAEEIRGTSDDPFHDDGRFLAALRLWRRSIEERVRAGGEP